MIIKKVAHIASFKGNIGDILNHEGFYYSFDDILSNAIIDKFEIRRFYLNASDRLYFDLSFAKKLNSYDLIILGGGGFFDLRWENSNTGTTMDLSTEFIDAISKPVLVNAMGYHEYHNRTSKELINKMRAFLSYVNEKDNWFVSVRNDGSYNRLLKFNPHNILEVPDNGFLYNTSGEGRRSNLNTIGMCITIDLFSKEFNGNITPDVLISKISLLVNLCCKLGKRIIFFPHIPSDVIVISKIISSVDGEYMREQVVVAPYSANDKKDIETMIRYYRMCDVIIGMRFHSIVLSIINSIPCIALAGHSQIQDTLDLLGLHDYCIRVCDGFSVERVIDLVFDETKLLREVDIEKSIINECKIKNRKYKNEVKSFLSRWFGLD